jgi:hypothetical protein
MDDIYAPLDSGPSPYWFDPDTGAERYPAYSGACTGNCVYGRDILSAADGVGASVLDSVAYPDPRCRAHGGHDVMPLETRSDWMACDRSLWLLADAYYEGLALEPT